MVESGARRWWITLTVIVASMLELIDTTVVNVSMPQIMGNLGATMEDVSWVVTAYSIANVIILPMSGWLAQRFGRKNYFITSIIIFTIASFFCGHADNIWQLVGYRFIQGLAGGGLLTMAQSTLIETWPKEQMGMATALFGLGVVVAPTMGPTLGGWITDNMSWPWVFYINIPIGIIAVIMSMNFLRLNTKNLRAKVDWLGIMLLAISIGSLQTVLERGETEDWFDTTYITVLAFTAVIGLVTFIWWEMRIEHPVVNLRVMRHRSLALGMVTTFILGFGLFGSVFVFPIFCQNLLGFSAQQTGSIMIPGGLTTIVMMPLVGMMLRKRFPPQIMAAIGMLTFFVFTWVLSKSTLNSGVSDFFVPLIIRGFGLSLLFVPLTTLALSDVAPQELPQATGLNNMMRQLGGSFGIAILNTLLHLRIGYHRGILISHMSTGNTFFTDKYNAMVHAFQAAGKSVEDATMMAGRLMDISLIKQSLLLSYMDCFWAVGIFFLFVIPVLFLQPFKKKTVVLADAH